MALDTSDPKVARLFELCKKYLRGEVRVPDSVGAKNMVQPVVIRRSIIQCLSHYEPENHFVSEMRDLTADRFIKSCKKGYFDVDIWRGLDITTTVSDFSQDVYLLLSYQNIIDEYTQRLLLTYEWNREPYVDRPASLVSPEEPHFHSWLLRLERLKDFTLFGEFMAEKASPHLYMLCERLCDTNDNINIFVNNYHYHYGQYTESPRNNRQKKNDMLLRIIRILNRCA